MTFESKAKTTHDIWLDEEYAKDQFEGLKWVPEQLYLDAQKEISTLVAKVLEGIKLIDEWKQLNDDYHTELTKAEAKIEAANKILEEIPEPVGAKLPSINDLQIVYHQEELRQWRIRLHDALLIPRKEERITLDMEEVGTGPP
jgi:hypothetical protein